MFAFFILKTQKAVIACLKCKQLLFFTMAVQNHTAWHQPIRAGLITWSVRGIMIGQRRHLHCRVTSGDQDYDMSFNVDGSM